MCMEPEPKTPNKKVTVLGLGGSGGMIVHHIREQADKYNETYNLLYADWDDVNLSESTVETINIAGESNINLDVLRKSELIIVVAGLGGLFTSFATPMILAYAERWDIPIKLIVSTPASFEGKRRRNRAAKSLEFIHEIISDYKVFETDKLINMLDNKTSVKDVFKVMNETIYQQIRRLLNNYEH